MVVFFYARCDNAALELYLSTIGKVWLEVGVEYKYIDESFVIVPILDFKFTFHYLLLPLYFYRFLFFYMS